MLTVTITSVPWPAILPIQDELEIAQANTEAGDYSAIGIQAEWDLLRTAEFELLMQEAPNAG